ncbi:MAG: hypothetical protein KDK25_01885 [Leptospiraceae bacterium]|nr:hypothetical protein [Leptospiraceae bacterium]
MKLYRQDFSWDPIIVPARGPFFANDRSIRNTKPLMMRKIVFPSAAVLLALAVTTVALRLLTEERNHALLRKAEGLYRERKLKAALSTLNSILDDAPSWRRPLLLRGKTFFFTRQFPLAQRDFRSLREESPMDSHASVWLAKSLIASDNAGEGKEILQSVVRQSPGNIEANYLLARIYQKEGSYRKSILKYEDLFAAQRILGRAHLQYAEMLQAKGLEKRSRSHLRLAADIGSRRIQKRVRTILGEYSDDE